MPLVYNFTTTVSILGNSSQCATLTQPPPPPPKIISIIQSACPDDLKTGITYPKCETLIIISCGCNIHICPFMKLHYPLFRYTIAVKHHHSRQVSRTCSYSAWFHNIKNCTDSQNTSSTALTTCSVLLYHIHSFKFTS